MLLHQIGEVGQVAAALLGCRGLPLALKGFPRRGDSDVDILFCGLMDGADWLLVCRVDSFECLAVYAFDELVVDESVA